ncbi:MAG: NAD(P)/FAD-dependent oxidoreductase [Candidatus Marinimicrobia bacterium]|nr:NAD(P)/FAD-dependent oxidoreductase [Candidatus Neomarinimicrobiota bacterium]MCF7840398.1 NAD(P)/FAD-dependent oxidoreductase [Candidatus Neomarinimicrobiota bacterium]
MTDFDVVVVGGGPAGSMAAWYAAKGGAKTIILEKDRDIGYPVRCGEAVSDAGLRQFVEPEPNWIAASISNIRMVSPNGTVIDTAGQALGYVLHRRIFDYDIANKAVQAGAHILTKAYVTGLLFDNGRVSGVEYEYLGEKRTLSAKVVIGADGVESRVGRWAGLRTALKLRDTESCVQFSVANVDVDPERIDFYVGHNYAPGGYLWVFPKGDGKANIGLGVVGSEAKHYKAIDLLNRFMEKEFPNASTLTMICGGVPVAKTLKKYTADGIMLTGDAARMVNPVTGGGIVSGMHGGKLAGTTAAEAVEAGDFSEKFFDRYVKGWNKAGGEDHARLYRIADAVDSLSDPDLDDIAASLSKVPQEKRSLLKIFTTAAKKRPSILIDVARAFAGF